MSVSFGLPAGHKIIRLVELLEGEAAAQTLRGIETVFFQSAGRQSFASEEERDAFRDRWLMPYLTEFSEQAFVALDEGGEVSGYLAGCADTPGALEVLHHPADMAAFREHYAAYPAHFHINVAAGKRGQGIGAALVSTFAGHCRAAGVMGVHVITAKDARNVDFYRRCGMAEAACATVGGKDLVLLAMALG